MSAAPVTRLALFDFDGTLTTRDSLMPFLRFSLGTPRFAAGMLAASPILAAYALKLMRNDEAKQRLLARMFGGRALQEVARFGAAFASSPALASLLRPEMMQTLAQHRAEGDTCVLVSASLDLYLEPWARAQGFAAVLCSRLSVDAQGRVNGRLEEGNVFGPEKVQRIQRWLAGRQPQHVVAYGDSRGDREMLAFAHEPHWIGRTHA